MKLLVLFTFLVLFIKSPAQHVVISEFQSANNTTISDEYGDFDDWIEIHNPSDSPVEIGGMVLKNNAHIWGIPTGHASTLISSGGYFFIWADHEEEEGVFHANFRLSANETVILCQSDSITVIDSTSVPELANDESYGRCPDGSWQVFLTPTPKGENNCVPISSLQLHEENILVYPTRANDKLMVQLPDFIKGSTTLKLISLSGITLIDMPITKHKVTLNLNNYLAGMYMLIIETENVVWKGKVLITD